MAKINELFLLVLKFFLAQSNNHEKPVSEIEWRGRCLQDALALNDCNWCRCNKQFKYTCNARHCAFVDKFGHFNDAIRDINVGMEGRGSWRTTGTACEPGVPYRRADLLCVCTEDGTWPNPVCRDVFRVLHSVEQTGDNEVTGQSCSTSKLYLVGCNVCICPSSGRLDPEFCTKRECSLNDPALNVDSGSSEQEPEDEAVEVYAECQPDHVYKLGCKYCKCLRNNRLHCGNCTTVTQEKRVQSFCDHVKPGQAFSRDCNLCYCDAKKFAYCTAKKCLGRQNLTEVTQETDSPVVESAERFEEENCIPGQTYRVDCNTCYCEVREGKKVFGCTMKQCFRRHKNSVDLIHIDCVKGTTYELNCLICQCGEVNGIKTQLCWVNPDCTSRGAVTETRSWDLSSLHGYCEPLHSYKRGCNTCHCLSDGKTVRCTSYSCPDPQPVTAELVPVAQAGECPSGRSYKIQCNYCFCLSTGNAICTTRDCSS